VMARATHIDGKLPNLALMKYSHWLKSRGYGVRFSKRVRRELDEPDYDLVFGSAIFSASAGRVREFLTEFPGAVVGGTWDPAQALTVEQHMGVPEYEHYDYSLYPGFAASMGFTARGCRLRCGFCVVPGKEGRPRSVNTIADIWRGPGHPKHLHLLDNDFFGQPREQWRARLEEIRAGAFRICLNQGINVRVLDDEAAEALASVPYYDDSFKVRRLYTAWDNLEDERIFLRGVERLEKAGIPPRHLMVYMLVGWDPAETWERIMRRFNRMVTLGIRPYPMIYGDRSRGLPGGGANADYSRRTLGEFQRWVIRKSYNFVPFEHYDANAKGRAVVGQMDLFEGGA